MVGRETEQTILQMKESDLDQVSAYTDLKEEYGPDLARQRLAEDAGERAMYSSGTLTALLGTGFAQFVSKAVAGKLSQRLPKETLKGLALEGTTEAAQSTGESVLKQEALNEYVDTPYNVAETANEAVAGTLAGAATGTVTGAGGALASDGSADANTVDPDAAMETFEDEEIQALDDSGQPVAAGELDYTQPDSVLPEDQPSTSENNQTAERNPPDSPQLAETEQPAQSQRPGSYRDSTDGTSNTGMAADDLSPYQRNTLRDAGYSDADLADMSTAEALDNLNQGRKPEASTSELSETGTGVFRVPTDNIQVDPEQYQFRSAVNDQGVDKRMDGVKQWDDKRAGNVLLHRREDGSLYVADGHHRVDLARKLDQPAINARIVDEADGVDVKAARLEAAMNNIADGKAEPVDVAKVFRDSDVPTPEVRETFNLPSSQVVRDGEALSALSDNVFGMVTAGQMSEKNGAVIGAGFSDSTQQEAAASVFQRIQPETAYQRQLLVNEIRAAEFEAAQGEQGGLFGDDPQEVSLMQDRLKVLDNLRQAINSDKRLFKSLNENADRASEAGNQIATEANADITERSARSLDLLGRVTTTPALNDMVNRAAKRVYDGEKRADVVRELKQEMRDYEQGADAKSSGRPEQAPRRRAPAKQRPEPGAGQPVPEPDAAGADQTAQPEGGKEESVAPSLELESQTEEQFAEKERTRQQAEQAETDKRRTEEQRAQADDEAGNFTLTGSDRTADVAMAAGQDDMFVGKSQPSSDPALDPERIRKMAEGANKAREREAKQRRERQPEQDTAIKKNEAKPRPTWQAFEGVNVKRIENDPYVAVPATGKKSAARFDIIDTRDRSDIIATLKRGELDDWLQKVRERDGDGNQAPTKKRDEAPSTEGVSDSEASTKAASPSGNTIFTDEAAEKARAVLKRKLGQMNTGVDPEMYQAGITLAGYHIEKGARTFAAYAKAMVADMGDVVRPYLKQWYLGVKTDPSAESIEGMDRASVVEDADIDAVLSEINETPDDAGALDDTLYQRLDEITDNRNLKSVVADYHGIKASAVTAQQMKAAQEALEYALVRRAREIVQRDNKRTDQQVFDELLALYQNQPNLNVRSSSSMQRQAYSTPAPLAYLSSRLAGINDSTTVYEPTAGNGMLLIAAPADNVTANELDQTRYANLEAQGFNPTQEDASSYQPVDPVDAAIMNPPFGRLKNDSGKAHPVKVDGYTVKSIDHLIAARALEAIKDDGKATLIIGASKAAGEIGAADRTFFNWLYRHYNVTGHFEVNGDLYNRQGAGWPVRVITVNGRQQSSRVSPKSGEIDRADTWSEVYEQFKRSLAAQESDASGTASAGAVVDTNADDGPVSTEAGRDQQDSADGQPGTADAGGRARNTGTRRGSGRRAGADRDNSGNGRGRTDGGQPGEPDLSSGSDRQADQSQPVDQDARRPDAGGLDNQSASGQPGKPVTTGSTYQAAYQAHSSAKNDAVLTPNNMAQSIDQALTQIEREVGDLDAYVQQKLSYDTLEEMHSHFMGLQVDAVAAAIYNIENNKGIIIADQTGVGKGRQAAAIIRYARRHGKTPVFMSVKPNLFSDMYGDLKDIGEHNVKPFVVNNGEKIIHNERVVYKTQPSKAHRDTLQSIAQTGEIPSDSDTVFMTYSQIQTDNLQRQVLSSIKSNAVFVLDEAHTVAGERKTVKKGKGEQITGAGFVFELIEDKPVVYLSATYAKRPDNMPVYYRTDLSQAVDDIDDIAEAVAAGGVPLQTVISNMLAQSGQLFRRERSFDGIEIKTEIDTDNTLEHEQLSDQVAEGLRAVQKADKLFHHVAMKSIKDEAQGAGGSAQGAGNRAGNVDHQNFSSVIHNYISQLLLGLKVKRAADNAIAQHKAGVKPVLALENTMGSFLQEYADGLGLEYGDAVEASYKDVLSRALERSRRYSVTAPNGDRKPVQVALKDLDPVTRSAYKDAQAVLDQLDVDDIPLSPIDYMRHRMEQAGIKTSELTGRSVRLDYSETPPTLMKRDVDEQKNPRGTVDSFNAGRLDAIILNVSGSTGLSIHASEKFTDQKSRHMTVVQAPRDINILMQMLGRINRTGQVKLPTFTMLGLDIPAEKRPLAVTSKKMKSLNANTSANDKSDTSVEAPDILNKYGDQVVTEYLTNNPDIARELDIPITGTAEGDAVAASDNVAMQFTGRLARMPVDTQRKAYADIESSYSELIDYLNKTGQNDLEPQTIDLDARIIDSKVIYEGKAPGAVFGGDTTLHKLDAKYQGRPPNADDVRAELNEATASATPEVIAQRQVDALAEDTGAQTLLTNAQNALDKAEQAWREDAARDGLKASTPSEAVNEANAKNNPKLVKKYGRHEEQIDSLTARLKTTQANIQQTREMTEAAIQDTFTVGSHVRLDLQDDVVIGVVTGVKTGAGKDSGNPYALSKTRVQFMVNNGARTIALPLTKLQRTSGIFVEKLRTQGDTDLDQIFSTNIDSDMRETRYLATGNLIAASAGDYGGRIVSFTDSDGAIHQGLLMPKRFDEEKFEEAGDGQYVPLRDLPALNQFLTTNTKALRDAGGVFDAEQLVRLIPNASGDWSVTVPKANKERVAREVKFNQRLLDAMGTEFYGSGATMEARFDTDRLGPVVNALSNLVTLNALPSMREAWEAAGGAAKPEAVQSFDDGPQFSRQPQATSITKKREAVQQVANRITQNWNDAPPLNVVADESELPRAIRREITAQNAEGEVRGVHYQGQIYLVAANINSSRAAEETILHEVVGHYGLRAIAGAELKPLLNKVWLQMGGTSKAQAIIAVHFPDGSFNPSNTIHRQTVAEELIAHAAEDGKYQSILSRIAAAVQNALRKLGFSVRMNTADLQRLLRRSHDALANGGMDKVSPGQIIENSKPAFSRAAASPTDVPAQERQAKFWEGFWQQPVDRSFRALFDVTGQVDAMGRWRGGVILDNKIRDTIVNWKPHPDGAFSFMAPPLEVARAGLIDRYGLSDDYKMKFREAESYERRKMSEAIGILKTLDNNSVDANEARVLQAVLTGEQVPGESWAQIAKPIQRAIDTMGREAADLGIITEAAYQQNKGEYLHRSYLKHEGQFTGLSKFVSNLAASWRRKIHGNSAKRRGMDWKVGTDKLMRAVPDDWYGQKKKGERPDAQMLNGKEFVILQNPGVRTDASGSLDGMGEGGQRRKTTETVYWPADRAIPARYEGWTNRGEWRIAQYGKDRVTLHRDYTKAERERMGEILDARYNIAKTFQTLSHDLAMGRFFADIARNGEWFQMNEPSGVILSPIEARRLSNHQGADWVQVPSTTIKGSSGTKQWGALAGGYVRPEIWRDLNELDKMHQSGTWRQVMTQWKLNKTARSPVVHMNNVMSNFMLMDMADVRLSDFISGLRSYANRDSYWQDAQEHGAFEGTLVNEEIRREVIQPLLDEMVREQVSNNPGPSHTINFLNKFTTRLWQLAKSADRGMTNAYQAEDELFRMGTYMRRLSLGETAPEAAMMARDQFLDYDIRAPWVNTARRTVLPFVAYTYRAVPVVAQSMMHRPWKFAKYATLAYLANMMAYDLEPGDEEEERESMREMQQGLTWLGTPRMLRMPYRDEYDNPMFLDVRRWIPISDVFDTQQGHSALPLPAPLIPGGPLVIGAEFVLNKQGFTGDPITNPDTDTSGQMAAKTFDWIYKQWMPSAAYIPGSWYWDKISRANDGGRDLLGRPYSVPQALVSSIGIKLQPHDVALGQQFRQMDLNAQRRQIMNEARRLQGDYDRGLMPYDRYQEEALLIRQKLTNLQGEARELAD